PADEVATAPAAAPPVAAAPIRVEARLSTAAPAAQPPLAAAAPARVEARLPGATSVVPPPAPATLAPADEVAPAPAAAPEREETKLPAAAPQAPAAAPSAAPAPVEEEAALRALVPVALPPASAETDEAPVGPAATIGALAVAHAAAVPETAPAAASAAAPTEEEVTLVAADPGATPAPPADAPASAAPSAAVSASGDGPSASGAAATPAAPEAAAATPTPAAAPAAPESGPRTFLIDDGAPPGATSSEGTPATPPAAPDSDASPATAAAPLADASTPITNAPAGQERTVRPEEAPSGTTIIPTAAQQQSLEPTTGAASQGSQVINYEANQEMPLNEPQLHSLQEFMNEGVNTSPLGVELQEGARQTKNGREVDGLLVVALEPGSPAERAGVQAGHREAHDVLEGAAVAASLVFPPAVLAVPVIETIQLGENYDLIIGIDGNRVTNFMDFQDQLRDARPGETVYLNILRGGKRLQIPVEMPAPSSAKLQP
ncbi:MAG: PDZ domain-containing protein, partial [Candidatus Binataceae bacterium]